MRSRSLPYTIGFIVIGVVAVVAVAVTSSMNSSDKEPASATTQSSTIRIAFIPKNTGNPYFEPVLDGFEIALQDATAAVDMIAPATADATSQIPIIKDQIQRGVDVIAICPNSPDAVVPVLEEAKRKGILVITVDSDLVGNEKARTACVIPADAKLIGESQIEMIGSLLNYQGKFAILSATADAPNQNAWIKVMMETLKNPKYKGLELVDTVYGNDEPQKSLTECEALLNKHPDLKGILSPTTVGITAAAQCVANAKKSQQIKVTGLGTPNQMRSYIKDGTVEVFALWSPYEMGYLTGQLSYQLATKKLTAEPGTTFHGGALGERQFKENNVIVTGIMLTITKFNIDQFNF